MKKVLLRIPEEQAEKIEKLAEKLKVSANDIYKIAVLDLIVKYYGV